ncbi:DUF1310 family protein [Alloscardovia theropitheci]|uniref:DUF1310 family protein n=2 Tax=Alloscardovia theropitheci TaxID=2496842 RepID=A0A4R0QUA3_9BIFI|nr:DUF1310 family protein [Alloscardovia theropitheci]TCD54965.1 DUF1310 family protein [Alloscardovia theropitheci]
MRFGWKTIGEGALNRFKAVIKRHRVGFIAGIIVIILLGVGVMVATQPMRDQAYMNEIVTGPQGRELIEARLHRADKKALTPSGRIKSYEIKTDTIRHNPMGGISADIILNNNSDLRITLNFNRDNSARTLRVYEFDFSDQAYSLYKELGVIKDIKSDE